MSLDGLTEVHRAWLTGAFAKACCRVDSEEELMQIHDKALEAGLEVHLITDSGRTEFHGQPTPAGNMRQKPPTLVKLVVLLTLMPICGIVALILVVFVLMGVGLWLEDNYELLFSGSKGFVIVAGTFAVGALAPLLLLWRWLGDEESESRLSCRIVGVFLKMPPLCPKQHGADDF